jgi:glycerol kinase
MGSILVIDVGTSSLRAAVVRPDGTIDAMQRRSLPPSTPFPGLVEFDALALAEAAIETATAALAGAGPVVAVGIANQRASTIVWDRSTGQPLGPALGWQDLRTITECIVAKAEHGFALAPNQSATKAAWLLDTYDAGRAGDVCIGTVDTWLAWVLSNGEVHATDHTNAAVTGLIAPGALTWNAKVCEVLNVPMGVLPAIVDSSGIIGTASALPGAPPIAALVGDQQASLVGQSCVRPGQAKITFGTGGMLDVVTGQHAATDLNRGAAGSFPIVAWSRDGQLTWGAEAIMLSAGTNVEWLRDDLGIIADAAESHTVAAQCADTDGVAYVPALLGLGTPRWDYGARGALFGLTRGSARPHIVRAVLEGVAQRGADLVDATEADTGQSIGEIRIDGGMSTNATFVQAVANATQRPIAVSPVPEATTLGAAYLAGLAAGTWGSVDDLAGLWRAAAVVEPTAVLDRERWAATVERAAAWYPELTALDF